MLQFDLRVTVREVVSNLDESVSDFDYSTADADLIMQSLTMDIEGVLMSSLPAILSSTKEARDFEYTVSLVNRVK